MKVQLITILLAVPLLNILQGLGILSVSSHCLVDQKSLLLQFKNNLKFNSTLSSKLVLWNQSTDCCTWEGVTCSTSGNSGHVIGLDLNSESISGCLQNSTLSSLSNFQYLESLNLAFNNFSSSEFPAGIFSLTSLKYLNLSTSGFSGKIPSSIANLTQLVYLDFWTNNFSGTISSIHFENLVNLEYIDLGLNLLSGIIPSSLFALPSLRKLFLSYNNFHGSLPNFTNTHSSQLDTLYSSWNNLSGSVPNSLFELQSFSRLTLSHNKLSGEFKLQNLHRLGNLTYFNLSFNNLSLDSRHNSSSKFLPPMLKELKLASCRLRQFPELRNLPSLITLDLAENQIPGDIPNWIWNVGNGGLQYLNLSVNRLEKLEEPYVIHNLSWIDLRSNHLRGKLPIPPKKVYFLDYSNNFFSSAIPTNINLPAAIFFSVSSNRLSGNIPVSLCSATNLQLLDLSNNHLTGNLPSCLFTFSDSLGVLKLGNNSLTGNISGIFENECALQTIDVSGNLLRGTVPESLAKCVNLEVLNLGNNQLNDSFPCFLKDSPRLHVLVLHSNAFHGGIMCRERNGSWENLQIYDIASNYFTGNLSQNFAVWKAMKDGRNDVNILGFQFSSFGNSRKTYQDAVTINIKGKQLELVKILNIFTSVDISNNHFEGNIPHTIGNQIQTFSDASFERNKGLCGAPLQLKCGGVPVITVNYDEEDPGENIKWEFVAPEVGFAVGLGIVILPLILNKRWRSFYYERVDHMLFKVFRIKHQKKNIHGRIKSRGSRIQRARN
ncbi:receptor like protein 27-like isoform X2 [Apium graveolens]|uniref:receptor like protein 27-like isoform X2 n=1 Tax=Apium graveolens TaxID=4045 RepID=UPI003D7C139E